MKRVWKNCMIAVGALLLAICMPKNTYAQDTGIRASATATSSSEIQLKWNGMENAESYSIYRRSSSETEFQKIKTQQGTQYRDRLVRAAVSYYYKIVPVSKETGNELKNAQAVVKAKAPVKTSIQKVTVKSATSLKLYWKASSGADGYEVFRSASETGKYEKIAQVSGKKNCTYTDGEVTPGQTYYYKVRSVNKGENAGSYSSPAKGKTIAQTTITSIASLSSDKMQITWKKVKGAKGYEVYRSSSEKGKYKKIATLSGSVRKYVDRTVKSGKKYYYKIAPVGSAGGIKITGEYSKAESFRALKKVKISSVKTTADDGLKIKWSKVAGATKYKVYRATSKWGSYQKIATVSSAGALNYTDYKITPGKTYYYKVQAYSDGKGLITSGSGTRSEAFGASTSYAIMGKTTVTAKQMAAMFKATGKKFPASVYKNKGAGSIEAFCNIVVNESNKEGVRAEVIFAQICLETGYLQFGGQVRAEQCNFSGIGATDDGAAGATFSSVRIGIRAQVQHLKGYASKDSLNQKCVDPRFVYLSSRRGTAKYVQSLGNGNWATDPGYATKLMGLIKAMKSY